MAWSDVVKKATEPTGPSPSLLPPLPERCLSSREGISVAVVDANALITSASNLFGLSERFVTVKEVLEEVRDPASRLQLAALPFVVDCVDPSDLALSKVLQFARETGDLHSLSNVDLKLIALCYTLEEQAYGSAHLRAKPPPFHFTQTRGAQDQNLPGWGSNVPNLDEWEELSQEADSAPHEDTHILGLKGLSLHTSEVSNSVVEIKERPIVHDKFDGAKEDLEVKLKPTETDLEFNEADLEDMSESNEAESIRTIEDGTIGVKEEEIQELKEWQRAVSRSTRRKHEKRAARAGLKSSTVSELDKEETKETKKVDFDQNSESCVNNSDSVVMLDEMHDGSLQTREGLRDQGALIEGEASFGEVHGAEAASSYGTESENSWVLRPLSSSNVACITADFPMQNVLLQIGLRVMSPNGLQVRQLHRWVLKCEACRNMTSDVGRIFCPKCGNGGTLYKVSVVTGPNGIIHNGRRRRINLRGTKYSLPLPKGGRKGVTENPILREDQLPHKVLHPRKKKVSGEEFFTNSEMFAHKAGKKGQVEPPVREALAILGGKRNPNDSRFKRR